MTARTQICLSVDTEFSIAGHFEDPQRYAPLAEPVVYGMVAGKSEGLGFLLETLDRYQLQASFFVECANYCYFGDEPMRSVVETLKQAAQDCQLHIHPVWLSFSDQPPVFPRHDNCAGRPYDEILGVIRASADIFQRWTGRLPDAVRTGSLRADLNVYRALAEVGIPLASNLGLGVYQPQEPELRLLSGRHRIEGVMELPVFTYQDRKLAGKQHLKSLQITSCSWPEMKYLLLAARRAGVEQIVVLTHPFEYFKKSDFRYRQLRRNRINQNRLQRLCAFIRDHDQEFEAVTFASQRQQWSQSEVEHPLVKVPTAFSIGRQLHNRLNDWLWAY